MNLRNLLAASAIVAIGCAGGSAAEPVSVDSCRAMALANNKQIRIRNAAVEQARYQNKEARAAYLPGVDFAGGYMYNSREISIFDKDQLLPTESFNPRTGKYEFNLVTDPATGMPIKGPDGQYVPSEVALIPKEAMTYDIHNVFFGAVTLTQPVYMGGKIVAMNRITKYAETLAADLRDNEAENVVYKVDAAYWTVVSLKAKEQLAESYVALLDTLRSNVGAMVAEGVATQSDLLTVEVKLNSAQVDLVKVQNGLALARMALAQVCGLPIDTPMALADEGVSDVTVSQAVAAGYNMTDVYARRPDLRALGTGVKIMEQKARVEMASMLPNVALVGSYTFSTPNMFNGFKKKVDGMFSVGAMVTVPLWHWGGNYNRYKAAKTAAKIAELELDDARTMVDLQVSQAAFKAQEAVKTYNMTVANIASAQSNLEHANYGFQEGVMTTQNVMEAQTAWLKAYSEKIDAMIDVRLCDVYLAKVLGTLQY